MTPDPYPPHLALPLPPHPLLEDYLTLAARLADLTRSADPEAIRAWAVDWVCSLTSNPESAGPLAEFAAEAAGTTAGAQRVIARAHGFADWPALSAQIQGGPVISAFEHAADAIVAG